MSAKKPTITEEDALLFHMQGRPGKIEIMATKPRKIPPRPMIIRPRAIWWR